MMETHELKAVAPPREPSALERLRSALRSLDPATAESMEKAVWCELPPIIPGGGRDALDAYLAAEKERDYYEDWRSVKDLGWRIEDAANDLIVEAEADERGSGR